VPQNELSGPRLFVWTEAVFVSTFRCGEDINGEILHFCEGLVDSILECDLRSQHDVDLGLETNYKFLQNTRNAASREVFCV
jgi:hypothetical protein